LKFLLLQEQNLIVPVRQNDSYRNNETDFRYQKKAYWFEKPKDKGNAGITDYVYEQYLNCIKIQLHSVYKEVHRKMEGDNINF